MILLSYILIYVSLIWTFASSNPIPQRRRNRVEEEFLKSYFGSGFNFRANRNRNRKIDDTKDAINTSKNYATVSIVINYLKFLKCRNRYIDPSHNHFVIILLLD